MIRFTPEADKWMFDLKMIEARALARMVAGAEAARHGVVGPRIDNLTRDEVKALLRSFNR